MSELVALVVGGVDYGDADRVVHLLTAHGRASAFAHGARKSRRRFQGALEPFTTIRVTLEPRKRGSDAMPTMRSAIVEHARLAIRDDLAKIALASYVVELSAAAAPEGEASDAIYHLAEHALDRLLERAATVALRRAFELSLVDALGYRPHLDACAICGGDAEPPYLELARGGLLCAEHRAGSPEIGPRTLAWMRKILAGGETLDEDAGLGADWSDRASRKLAIPMMQFFSGLLGRRMKSLALLEELAL